MSADPQVIAAGLMTEVANELSSGGSINLVAIVRKLLRASELLGWDDAATRWRSELSGCQNSEAPSHRYTNASVDFQTSMMQMYSASGGSARPSSRATTRSEPLCHPLADLVLYKDCACHYPCFRR